MPPAPRFPPRHSGTPGGCLLIGEQVPPHALSLPSYWLLLPAQLLLARRRHASPLSAAMAAAGGRRSSEPGQTSAPGGAGDTSLLGSATTWPLKRYGRFLPPTDSDDEGQNTSSWKVKGGAGWGWLLGLAVTGV